jgi:hypothetical protein
MRLFPRILVTCVLVAAPWAAHAACDDLVIDEANIINDVGKVTAAAHKLGGAGADVRVRTIRTLGDAQNLDDYERALERQCPSWQSGGHRKSTMLVITYLPTTRDAGVYFGAQLKPKLDPVWVSIRNSALQPAISAYRNGEKDAYTKAFVAMLGGFDDVLRMSSPSGGPTTIVHREAADFSWIWKTLLGLALLALLGGAAIFYFRTRQDKGEAQAYQAEARRVRRQCLQRLLTITDPSKQKELNALILALKARLSPADSSALQAYFDTFQQQGRDALAAFGRFDDVDKEDPNANGLPASVYRSNEQAYEDIIASSIEPAEESLRKINELLGTAHAARVA